jgi:spermidine/putrescine transport system ATP-binding protein
VNGSTVSISNVSKHFGSFHALDNVNITINKGEFFSLLGPSGCGKTTLLRIIAGFEFPDDGVVLFDDKNVIPLAPNKRQSNTVFQSYALFPHLSVYDNVALSLELHHKSPKEHNDEILGIIEKVGLKNKENRAMNEISGGERQRVAIARALVKNPKVIIADEPTGNLDTKNRDVVMDILKELSKDRLVLIVTHDKEIATKGDYCYKIVKGKLETVCN